MSEEKIKVLFVCTGNTCRSPMAEALLRHEWEKRAGAPLLEVLSAGLAAAAGEKASEHARAVMREEGLDLEMHRSAALDEKLAGEATLILVMSRRHRDELLRRFPAAADKTYLLKEFAGISGDPDVADPFGGTMEDYRRIYEELRAGIEKIAQILEGGRENGDSPGQ